jgi:hypothetical protein
VVVVLFGKFCIVTDQQVRGLLAARWIIIGRSWWLADCEPRRPHPGRGHLGAGVLLLDWHPGDRLPYHPGEPAVLPPVSEPADPGAVPQRRRNLPQTLEYRPYSGDDNDEFNLSIDLTLSSTPIPRRAPASPTPLTPPSPPNPLRYRAGPAHPPPRPIKKISKRKAITIEQRALRA